MLGPADALAHLLDERLQVRQALAQGRQLDPHLRDAEEQVAAEAARVHLGAQIAPRGREHAHVDGVERVAAHALDLLLGERAQQLGLQLGGQLAQLVEEQRAAVGLGQRALAPLAGPRERALLVPEQDALGQRGRDAAAVDHHERRPLALARVVQRLGHELLARTGLAHDEDAERRARDLLEHAEHAPHARRAADQGAEAVGEPDVDTALGLRLEVHARAPREQLDGRGHDGLAHAHRAEERAVGAAEVLDQDALAHGAQLAVERADLLVVDDDLRAGIAPHDERVDVDGEHSACGGLRDAPRDEPVQDPGARPAHLSERRSCAPRRPRAPRRSALARAGRAGRA